MADENVIQINPEQISLLKACGRRIENLRVGWVGAARQVGEWRDQLRMLEDNESAARQNLRQAEIEFDTTMKEIAVELGHVDGQFWKFNQDDFTFIVEPPPSEVPASPDTESGQEDSEDE